MLVKIAFAYETKKDIEEKKDKWPALPSPCLFAMCHPEQIGELKTWFDNKGVY